MKKLILTCLFFIPLFMNAQVKEMIKNDDPTLLVDYINEGNDINGCFEGYTILALSIKFDSKEVFKKCLELKADVNKFCSDKTPLIYAIKYRKMDYFNQLIEQGADKIKKRKEGKQLMIMR
jgi:ankyrin repeat protein